MNILITGATGFIGQHFIQRFDQHNYTIVTRSSKKAQKIAPHSSTIIQSLADLDNLNAVDAIVNLAGEPIIDKRWTKKQKAIICQSRWQITTELVNLITSSANPPAVFISGSAIGFYGAADKQTITEQQAAITNDFPHDICARWEKIAESASNLTRVVTLRTGIVLGKNAGALSKMLPPFRLGLGGKIGTGQQYMSWIHIDDMLRAMDFLLKNNHATGAFNLTAPEPVTNEVFATTLARVLGTRARIPVPEKLLRILMGQSAQLLLDSQRVVPEKLLKAGFIFKFPDLNAALSNLLGE